MANIRLYKKIKNILEEARSKTYRTVNFIMVKTYWNIGRLIVEEEQKGKAKAEYGKYLIKELSEKLTKDFGHGYSQPNLRRMRLFYCRFPIRSAVRSELDEIEHNIINHSQRDESKFIVENVLYPELSWTHYRLLLKINNEIVCNFYIKECIENNWSTRQLERQINSFLYERLLMSKEKQAVLKYANKQEKSTQVNDLIKDPYILDFLNLKGNKKLYETDLENAIINKLQDFLLELGKGFAFVSRQKRITVNGEHFYIDMVFYNYILKCFLLIDLKVGKLTHQDIGQIDFYVRYFEENLKQKKDNPTIGLILCSEKNEAMAHYSVLKDSKQLFASKYKLYFPSEKEFVKEIEKELLQIKLNNDK